MPIDKGTSKPITQLSSLQINYKDEYSCFNPPIVTTTERNSLVNTDDPTHPIKEGTMVYNSDEKSVQAYQNGGWVNVGRGDPVPNVVTSRDNGAQDNLVAYAGNDKTVKNSGVKISEVQKPKTKKNGINATPLYQLSNLGALQFGSNENTADTGVILVDGLTPVTFQTQGTGADSRVCTVINGELGEGSSSPSALLEINSTEGGLLHARMTTAQRDGLLDPKDGLEIYNTDTKNLNLRQNNVWVEIGSGSSSTILPTRLLSNSYYNATLDDCVIITQGGGSYTVNLPEITDSIMGKLFIIIEGVGIGNTNNVTVQGKISGLGSYVIKERFGYVALVAGRPSQGWSIISSSSNSASGNVIGPSASVNDNIAVFDGTSGKAIKDSGISLSQIVSKYLPFSTASFISQYNISDNDFFVVIYAASAGTTVNLPSLGITSNQNRLIIIKQAGVGSTTIIPASPDSIQAPNQNSYVLSTNNFVWLVGNSNRYWMPICAG